MTTEAKEVRTKEVRTRDIDLLLVSASRARETLLRAALASKDIPFSMRRITPGKAAVDFARRAGANRRGDVPDLILFDYFEPLKGGLAMLRTLTLGRCKACAPVVIMTGPDTEAALEDASRNCESTMMFSPVGLAAFGDRLEQHGRNRFLKAAGIMAELGPLLVRLPDYFQRQPDDVARLIA